MLLLLSQIVYVKETIVSMSVKDFYATAAGQAVNVQVVMWQCANAKYLKDGAPVMNAKNSFVVIAITSQLSNVLTVRLFCALNVEAWTLASSARPSVARAVSSKVSTILCAIVVIV